MINCDFERIKKRYSDFWDQTNDTALISVVTDKDNACWEKAPKAPESKLARWTDVEYLIKKTRFCFENTAYYGESFPQTFANLGPDIFGAILGGDIEFGDDTSWAVHENKTLDDLKPFYFDEQNIWYRRMMSITEELLKDSRGDYLVGNNDFHTTIGALASLIGPEEMCVSLLTDPETVKERLNEGQAVYHIVFHKISELIERYQKGHTNWMGLYCDKNWYVPSCDESCLISVEAFEEFVVPHLKEELKMFSRAIYHLDGKDALRHLDVLLSIKEIDGIQWVYGEGQPTARHWIPLLQKIQKAGKRIEICVEKDDIKPLLENLAPQGLSMRTRAKNETEAKEMVAFVQNFRKA